MKKVFCFIIIFFSGISLNAAIAVFPFEDLSKDLNGLDLKISTIIANKLVDKGFDVVYPMEIMSYFEKIKNPVTGWVDRITGIKVYKIFHCNLILLGTILEKNRDTSEFSIAIRMISLPQFKLEWGNVATISKSEQISILELKKKNWETLINETLTRLLNKIPNLVLSKATGKPEIDIESVEIFPKFAQKGKLINCRCRVKLVGKYPDQLYLKILNKRIKIKLIKNFFSVKFKAPTIDNRYPISLVCIWGKPFNITKRLFLGSFYVDNKEPELKLNYKFANKINGKLYFSKFLKIIPVLKKHDYISRWIFEVFSLNDNKTLTEIKNYGKLPKFFIWKGVTSRGTVLPNGEYRIILSVWDKAGNFSKKYIDIYLVKAIYPPRVSAIMEDKKIFLKFNFGEHPVPISICDIEIFDINGNLIANKNSDKNLIKEVKLLFRKNIRKVYYSVYVRDILGNKLKLKRIMVEIEKKEKKKKIEKIWLNEF